MPLTPGGAPSRTAVADGELSDDEVEDLLVTAQQIPGCEGFTADDLSGMIEQLTQACTTEEALDARIDSLTQSVTNPQLQRLAYQLLMVFAARDGELSDVEDALISHVQESWGIPDDEAEQLAEAAVAA